MSVGIAYEASRNRLWVAGGGPGFGWVSGMCGSTTRPAAHLLATFLPPGDVGFLNDVAITHDAVYVTDSFNPQLVKIPLPADGSLPSADSATLLPVSGDLSRPQDPTSTELSQRAACSSWGRPARGISSASTLTLGPPTRSTLAARLLPGPDGLELRGNTLYVVGGGLVTVVRLGPRLASGVVLGEITDPGLDVPTTATVAAGRLWVVNARFDTPPLPTTDYWITQLPLRPAEG